MTSIRVLPEEVVRKIAAGEVIERPANVLKELVENSLDAGATRITVELAGAGRQLIRVSDDGCGMSSDELRLAIQPHATSKLTHLEDLQRLQTLGFRGEALPSIGAVSHLTITTRAADAPEGLSLTVTGGVAGMPTPCGAPQGTTVAVRDLFFNTPARANFLKADATERSHLIRTLEELALAFPQVAFEMLLERASPWHLPAVTDVTDRILSLFGASLQDQLLVVDAETTAMRVTGVIGTPAVHQLHRRFQLFFVNRRPVTHRSLTHALYEGYRGALLVDRHPVAFLWLTTDPGLVDVNVHPTKREVRFSQERLVHDVVSRMITQTLQAKRTIPTLPVVDSYTPPPLPQGEREGTLQLPRPPQGSLGPLPQAVEDLGQGGQPLTYVLQSGRTTTAQSGAHEAAATYTTKTQAAETQLSQLVPLAQLSQLYILAQAGQDLVIIDQHAAGERILYERFWREASAGLTPSQPLLVPEVWELSSAAMKLVEAGLPAFTAVGFELAPFGRQAWLVKALPAPLGTMAHVRELLDEIVHALEEEREVTQEAYREVIVRAGCRAAIKANDRVAPQEMTQLLRDLARCDQPMTCPHGRPTLLRIPFHELHRYFRRT